MSQRPGREIKGPVITTGNPDTVNDAPVTVTTVGASYNLRGQLGAIYRTPDGQKEYIYAQFSSTSTGKTPAANQVCFFWSSTSTSTTNPDPTWVVDNQTSAGNAVDVSRVAGILRNACTRGNYVWLMRRSGANAIPVVSTSTGAALIVGTQVYPSTSSGEAIVGTTSTSVPATGPNATPWFMNFGVMLGTLASTSTGVAFVGSTSTSGVSVNLPVYLDIA